jgi:tetratricopeptide (TPR) repeat protein
MSKKKPAESNKKQPQVQNTTKKEEVRLSATIQTQVNPLKKWGGLILAILAFLLYSNTLNHKFAFDDSIVIVENKFTQQGLAGIPELVTTDFFAGIYGDRGMELTGGRYRPLSLVSFAIENQFFGKISKEAKGVPIKDRDGNQLYEYNPFYGHLFNVLLYALTAYLMFRLLSLWFDGKEGMESAVPFITTLLFVAHPVHTEVVANIKSRDEILAMLLLLTSLYSLHLNIRKFSPLLLVTSVLTFFAAMLSKENAFTFVLIVPFTIFLFEKDKKWSDIIGFSIPFWVAAALYFTMRSMLVGSIKAETNIDILENPFYKVELMEKLATIALVLWKYLQLMLWPHPLSSDYSREQISIVGFSNPIAILGLLTHILMATWVILRLFKKDIFALSILIYFLPLSLTINLLFNIGAPMADRFLYLPSLGFCIAIASFLTLFFKVSYLRELISNKALLAIILLLTVAYSIKTFSRNPDWYDNLTLFEKDVKSSKNSAKINYYYANTLFKKFLDTEPGKQDSTLLTTSEKYFAEAVRIYPGFHTALYNLGFINVLKKEGKKAEAYLLKSIQLRPGYLNGIEMLGRTYGELLGNLPEAENYLNQAIVINKHRGALDQLASNYQHIGIVYAMQKKYDQAVKIYLEAIKLAPNEARNYLNLGITYQQMGQMEEGQKYLNKAFELNPALKR